MPDVPKYAALGTPALPEKYTSGIITTNGPIHQKCRLKNWIIGFGLGGSTLESASINSLSYIIRSFFATFQ